MVRDTSKSVYDTKAGIVGFSCYPTIEGLVGSDARTDGRSCPGISNVADEVIGCYSQMLTPESIWSYCEAWLSRLVS